MWLMVYVVVLVAVLQGGGEAGRSNRARHGWSKGYSVNSKPWSTSPNRNGRAQFVGRNNRQEISQAPNYMSMINPSIQGRGRSPAIQGRGSMMAAKPSKGYTNYAKRCRSCGGATRSPVCGSDGKTYPNQCELEYVSCRKYWDITVVNQGPCKADCPGVEDFGFYTGFGLSRASNKGYCIHDYFRCCRTARKIVGNKQAQTCCQGRFDKCHAFVAAKPWRAGVKKYGRR